jgi:hypothetical protein
MKCYICKKLIYDKIRGKHKNGGITFDATIKKNNNYGGSVKIIEKTGYIGVAETCKDCASKLQKYNGYYDYIIDKTIEGRDKDADNFTRVEKTY